MSRRIFKVNKDFRARPAEGEREVTIKPGQTLFAEYPLRAQNGVVTFEIDNLTFEAEEKGFRTSTELAHP